jgi:hypothetical protein
MKINKAQLGVFILSGLLWYLFGALRNVHVWLNEGWQPSLFRVACYGILSAVLGGMFGALIGLVVGPIDLDSAASIRGRIGKAVWKVNAGMCYLAVPMVVAIIFFAPSVQQMCIRIGITVLGCAIYGTLCGLAIAAISRVQSHGHHSNP